MECLTVGDVIESLRCEILDPDGDIWSDKLIVDFIQQAYSHISALRPDLFSGPRTITLQRGTCFQEVCDCDRIVGVVQIDGSDCQPPDQESSQDNLNFLGQLFEDPDCPGDDTTYAPESWSFVDCGSCASFRLSEPTPEDRDVTAVICCTLNIDFCQENIEDVELPSILFNRMYEGFKHLVLSKLYATDRKCENLMKLSELHFKYWQDFRDWMFRTDFAANQSDWYLYRQKTTGKED